MARGNRRGFGTIRRMRSGRYQCEYTGPDLQRHRAPDTFTTRMDAEGWLTDERRSIEGGNWKPPSAVAETAVEAVAAQRVTLADYGQTWLATRPLKPRTTSEYRRLLTGAIVPTLGAVPVSTITPAVVRTWYAQLDAKKPTRRAHAYQLLRAILSTAVDDELLPANPCRIRAAGSTSRARDIRPPTAAELATIVSATPAQYQGMVLLASWCGLRFGELVALRRSDLDMTAGVVRVSRAAVRVDGEMIVSTPKSYAGRRSVSIPPHVQPALAEHLRTFVTGRDGLLFPTPGGLVMTPGNALNRWWHPARAAADRTDLRFHDLRHHGATLAAHAGATLPELQNRLGHSTVVAALRYQHLVTGRDAEIARRLSELAAQG